MCGLPSEPIAVYLEIGKKRVLAGAFGPRYAHARRVTRRA